MNDKEVRELYVQGLYEINYDQCMKAVGILSEKEHPDAIWLEAEILYLKGEYENCLNVIGSNRTKDSFELNEYYLACLLMLGRYPELRSAIRDCEKKYFISGQCGGFIESMMRKQKEKMPYRIYARYNPNSPFQREHLQFVVQELVDVYELQRDRLRLSDIGLLNDNSGQGPDLQKRMSVINMRDDIIDEIRVVIDKGEAIDPNLILNFFKKYFAGGLKQEISNGRKGQLRDILTLLDLERRLGLYNELVSSIKEYRETFCYAINRGNRTTAGHIKEVLFDLEGLTDKENYSEIIIFLRSLLKKWFPEMLKEEERLEKESRVFQLLHDQSKPMYKAAVWQYNMVSLDLDYGYRDAGMYCLAYIRLLECEMNQRVFPIFEKHYTWLKEINDALPKSQKNIWRRDIEGFNPERQAPEFQFTAGQWYKFFQKFQVDYFVETEQNCEELAEALTRIMKQEVFNELGYERLVTGRVAEIFDQSTIVEKYRNPPAHTKYVTLSIANECRSYVENSIIELAGYYK